MPGVGAAGPSSAQILALKVCDPAMGSGAFLAEACRYLARRLLDAWTREGRLPDAARDTDPLLVARRMVAERCLYGVDKNPFAVEIARLSLWLVTLAKDLPFTFVDHALREGDAVIGLSVSQIGSFAFDVKKDAATLFSPMIRRSIKDAVRDRAQILEPDLFSWKDKTRALKNADDEVYLAARRGDALLAAYWAGGSDKQLKQRLQTLHPAMDAWFLDEDLGVPEAAAALLEALPMKPFHWELEFPEVFARENPGFDAVVGNPPFGGKHTIGDTSGDAYIGLFQRLFPHVHGKSDIVAYFFLRACESLRIGGILGLVATNSIRQGRTRESGLQHLVSRGLAVYDAWTDIQWPVLGGASVFVDVISATWKGAPPERRLNGSPVVEINSALEAGAEQSDPVPLLCNEGRAYQGSIVLGTGFMLEPSFAAQLCTDPRNAEIIKPYIGGEELNTLLPASDGMVAFNRFVIDFGDRTLEEASNWPELLRVVRELVKPQRDTSKRDSYRTKWWRFAERQTGLYRALSGVRRCLASSQVSKHHLFAFQPTDRVFSHALNVFAFDDWFSFAVLQSRVHEFWARNANLGSTLETRARYTPSTCFETFPFPRPTDAQRVAVAAAGEALYEHRSALMLHFDEGMTKIWNRLLAPDETDLGVLRLRELRDTMDRAVLDAYGWSDLSPDDTPAIVKRLRALNAERAAEEKRRA